jgi:hypothetical protein
MPASRTTPGTACPTRLFRAVGADSSYYLWVWYRNRQWAWIDIEDFVLVSRPTLRVVRTFLQPVVSPDGLWITWPDGSALFRSDLDGPAGQEVRPGIYVRQVASDPAGWYRPLVARGLVNASTRPGSVRARLGAALALSDVQVAALLAVYPVAPTVIAQRLLDLVDYIDNNRPSRPARTLLAGSWEAGERAGNPDLRTPLVAIARGRLALVEGVYTARGRWV